MKQYQSLLIAMFWACLLNILIADIGLNNTWSARRSSVLVIAHRGGIFPDIPENTLSNFKMAIRQGVDIIEVDLRSSRDGQVLIMHDATLDRTTDGSGDICDYTLEELKELDAGAGEKIPTYEELLKLIRGTRVKLLLDVKLSPKLNMDKVIAITEKYSSTLDVIAGVRSLPDLDSLKKINPNIRTLGFVGRPEEIKLYIDGGVDIIRLWQGWVLKKPGLIATLRERNVPVWVTLTDLEQGALDGMIHDGVTGFITDFPEKLEAMLENMDEK